MILYPAIDIRGGKAVRLTEGDFGRETAYHDDPVDAALRFAEAGVKIIHVVDLDGARKGAPVNVKTIRRIADAVPFPIEVGGGLRDAESIADLLRAGAERVVIGTAAMRDPRFLAEMLEQHPERVVVSVDARGGKISLAGWSEPTDVDVTDAIADLTARGVERFLFTPIEVDGTLAGPGFEQLAAVAAATSASVIYSGGVGTIADLERLRAEAAPNVEGVIVGRALYEGRFSVDEAVAALA
ncbi:MAG TPA: 1-(5-phosphoribosyl)-5-[(5-phosphoribosylamino)methylideneamino]imidazole-4-carboxamide isomerase [Solirubrobacterales bacterium]|nr:1-(5-phosphoribosyl)-5-[(5-phosphoribosylamino)methylideneamino]imidazole-4-carboxamide isomerase [Solirubrobacterales bacterium]